MVSPPDLARGARESLRLSRRVDGGESSPVPAGHSRFVTMVKPEAVAPGWAAATLGAVLAGLDAGGVQVHRWAVEPASRFLARGMLARHYPRLHRIAAEGTSALCDSAHERLTSFCAEGGLEVHEALTPYDAFVLDADLDPAALEASLRDAGVEKLGPGSYVSAVLVGGRRRPVLNGFVPMMGERHRVRDSGVAVVECTSEREIADLRDHVLGTLDPASAARGTLRSRVAEAVADGGGEPLSEGRNGVHLSAGHLEGVFQAWHYIGAPCGEDLDVSVLAPGLSGPFDRSRVLSLTTDPNLLVGDGSSISPFGVTEGLPRDRVAELLSTWVRTPVLVAP